MNNRISNADELSSALPFGNIMLGIVDFDNRIDKVPYYKTWINSFEGFEDNIKEDGIIDYEGLNEHQKLCLFIYAWNKANILPSKKSLLEKFGWDNSKLQKLIKELNRRVVTRPTFNQNTNKLNGSGYYFYYA